MSVITILVNARGHGASDKPHGSDAYELDALTGDILAVLDKLKETKVSFWGFSMGGQDAYGMAKFAPDRLHSLIIGSSHPYGRTALKGLSGDDPEAFLNGILGRMGIDFSRAPERERTAMCNNDFYAIAACFRDREPIDDILPNVNVPCLLYVGDNDGALEKVHSCAECLPRSFHAVSLSDSPICSIQASAKGKNLLASRGSAKCLQFLCTVDVGVGVRLALSRIRWQKYFRLYS